VCFSPVINRSLPSGNVRRCRWGGHGSFQLDGQHRRLHHAGAAGRASGSRPTSLIREKERRNARRFRRSKPPRAGFRRSPSSFHPTPSSTEFRKTTDSGAGPGRMPGGAAPLVIAAETAVQRYPDRRRTSCAAGRPWRTRKYGMPSPRGVVFAANWATVTARRRLSTSSLDRVAGAQRSTMRGMCGCGQGAWSHRRRLPVVQFSRPPANPLPIVFRPGFPPRLPCSFSIVLFRGPFPAAFSAETVPRLAEKAVSPPAAIGRVVLVHRTR